MNAHAEPSATALHSPTPAASFGSALRQWRGRRGLSQLALALQADVSTRHISWLETGKAEPSRAMVLRLAEQLDLPLRARNALLASAGYAPLYRETAFDDAALAPARATLQRLLEAHAPAPALAVDRHWNLVAANRMLAPLLQSAAPTLLQPPLNVLRLSLHPHGLAPAIANLPAWRSHVLARLQRQAANTADPVLQRLLAELRALPLPDDTAPSSHDEHGHHHDAEADWAVPLQVHSPLGRLDFITTTTVFGAPHDVTLAEIAIETLLPADADTAARLRALQASLPPT